MDGRTDGPTDGQTLLKRCVDASKNRETEGVEGKTALHTRKRAHVYMQRYTRIACTTSEYGLEVGTVRFIAIISI